MKTKKIITAGLLTIAMAGFVLTGCRKEEPDTDTSAASDNALAEATFSDMQNMSNEAYANSSLSLYKSENTGGILSSCATISFDSISGGDADTITINFGSANCMCHDGRYRRGKVLVTYTGGYRDSGTVITIKPVDYYVNDNKVDGQKTVTNKGRNGSGNLYYDIAVNGTITLANGQGTITWTSNRTREWIAGESTSAWNDDVYLITGSANGTSSKGVSFSVNVTKALRVDLSCSTYRITSGTMDITPSGKPTRTVDFGGGACDKTATVSINGKTYTITLQ